MLTWYAQHARAGPLPPRLSCVDLRKACFNGTPKRNVFMSLPEELGLPSHVAKQVRCVHGTRDAGSIWEDVYRGALEAMGYKPGVASPCCFAHDERGPSVVVHGDEFTALGKHSAIDRYEAPVLSVELLTCHKHRRAVPVVDRGTTSFRKHCRVTL